MTPEEYKWYVKSVQDRYNNLNLTYEQAEQIHKYEQEKNVHSQKHFFSAWEEWDYELTTFRQILHDDQLKLYEDWHLQAIKQYEQNLVELDNQPSQDFAYHDALMNFYETAFLPDFFKDAFFLHFLALHADKPKVDYLKSEYRIFLNNTKKEILTSHFRHNRTFKPNELKVSLLHHKLSCILPDIFLFNHQMDEPTKAVANYIKLKFRSLPDETEKLLTTKFGELKVFSDANFKRHFGELKGWHVVNRNFTPEEEKEHRIMTLLLLDKDKYGCEHEVYK